MGGLPASIGQQPDDDLIGQLLEGAMDGSFDIAKQRRILPQLIPPRNVILVQPGFDMGDLFRQRSQWAILRLEPYVHDLLPSWEQKREQRPQGRLYSMSCF
jgi:hypothetical protein